MKSLALALATTFSLCAQTPDLYPQVRAIVLEAEAASTNIRLFRDHGDPHTWAGNILEHAGYLEDAERAYAESPRPSSDLPYIWRGWVVYGHQERAEKLIESATSAEKKAPFLASFADLLWRMGQPEQARARYDVARTIALRIVDPARRKPVLATIDQGLQFVSDPPPNLISATPHPRPRSNVQDSPIPPFPITPDGFQDASPPETIARSSLNGELMKRLYERAAAGDRAGIELITESAATPFQKAVGIGSLEHILIQQHEPELAEQYAKRIPETDSPSSLAKAEALSAAAEAWLRMFNKERARTDFDSAKQIVFAVPDLPLGKISVLASIAAAQFRGQLMDDSNASFRSAIELTQKLPLRPRYAFGVPRPPTPLGVHYKDEAFGKILRASIHVQDVQMANDTAEIWSKTGDNVGSGVVDAWRVEGRTKEAIDAARRIEDPDLRIGELLGIAGDLLNEAGAPIF
jgi:tetratricopeptide (TPR) repeat protein